MVENIENPLKRLIGKYRGRNLRYEEVEELGDRLIEIETESNTRAQTNHRQTPQYDEPIQ